MRALALSGCARSITVVAASNRSSIVAGERFFPVGWIGRLKDALRRTRDGLAGIETLAAQRRPLDAAFWDELEEILISADFGVATTEKILGSLKDVAHKEMWTTSDLVIARFKRDVANFLTLPNESHLDSKPAVMLIVGVNGSGKTTTIGKLAARFRKDGKRVLLVAAD